MKLTEAQMKHIQDVVNGTVPADNQMEEEMDIASIRDHLIRLGHDGDDYIERLQRDVRTDLKPETLEQAIARGRRNGDI